MEQPQKQNKENPKIGNRKLQVPGIKDESETQEVFTSQELSEGPENVREAESHHSHATFSRSPRDFVPYPKEEVVIQSPGRAEDPPDNSILPLLLPLAGSLTGIVLTLFAVASQTNQGLMFISLPMIIFSVLGGIYRNSQEKKKYQHKKSKREELFKAHLKESKDTLDRLVDQQRKASLITNPDLDECLRRVETQSARLWERKPEDLDFLDIRLGIGKASPTFILKPPPRPEAVQEPDELYKDALALSNAYSAIDNLAITLPLRRLVSTGLRGFRSALVGATRSLLIQIASHHAPSEVKFVLCIPENEISEWGWSRWLPHIWRDDHQLRMIAANDENTLKILADLELVLKQRKNSLSKEKEDSAPTPAFVFIFANSKVWRGEEATNFKSLLDMLLKEGAALGAYSIFLEEESHVPKECGAIVSIDGPRSSLKIIGPSPEVIMFSPDSSDVKKADRFARSLAGVRIEKGSTRSSDLPNTISLLKLLGVNRVEELKITENWEKTKFDRSLSVPLGIGTGGKLITLDMHENAQGAHGLLAGTTGSGKSELLQALITSLSIRYSPEKVAFIIIDFKALMVPPFKELPHQLGLITNLSGNLAKRAELGMKAEIIRREKLLDKSKFDDYQDSYFSGKASEPLPHLFIIVDEFAELKDSHPDFIPGLISLSALGRALGIHLLLATQKPAGVVNEAIWANSRARLCLRVERPEDSQEVLKRQDAAAIKAENRGRAYLQVGKNEIFEQFQSAWATAPYLPAGEANEFDIAAMINLDGSLNPLSRSISLRQDNSPPQMEVIISHIIQTRQQQKGIMSLKRPWLPPLGNIALLKDHRPSIGGWDGKGWTQTSRWLNPFIGVFDDPSGQTLGDLSLPLATEGNLCIYGAPGSGKTTLLQTIMISLVLDHGPKDVHMYIMDFGGRSFKAFEDLPHMGAIVLPDETERVHRLLQFIKQELDRRKKLLEPYGGKIADYRSQAKGNIADVVVFLDNYTAFANAYNEQVVDISRLASEGGNLGMHLIMTTNNIALPMSLSSNISQAIALELVDPSDYISVVGRASGITPTRGIPGRGLIKRSPPLEFQTALAVENPNELYDLVQKMKSVDLADAASRVPPIQDVVPLSTVLNSKNSGDTSLTDLLCVPVGIDLGTPALECFMVDLNMVNHLWISGPPLSGKTTLLQTLLLTLTEMNSPQSVKLYPVDMGCTSLIALSQLPHTQSTIVNGDQFEIVLEEIAKQLDERVQEKKNAVQNKNAGSQIPSPAIIMAIESLEEFRRETSEGSRILLSNLMRRKGLGFHVIATGASQDFSTYSHSDNLGSVFKDNITGFLIGYNNYDDLQYLPLKLAPKDTQKNLPSGTAFFVQRGGRYRTVQVATCHHGKPDFQDWIEHISKKWKVSNLIG